MAFDISRKNVYTGVNGGLSNLKIPLSIIDHLLAFIPKIRVLWIVSIVASVCLCGLMIHNIWNEWQLNPVEIIPAEKMDSIMTIPFPTVTICSEIKTSKNIFDISAALKQVNNHTGPR